MIIQFANENSRFYDFHQNHLQCNAKLHCMTLILRFNRADAEQLFQHQQVAASHTATDPGL